MAYKRKKDEDILFLKRNIFQKSSLILIGCYLILLSIGFIASGIGYRLNIEIQRITALTVCCLTLFFILFFILKSIINKSIRSNIFIQVGFYCLCLVIGVLLPYSVYDYPKDWIWQENLIFVLLPIPIIIAIFFTARAPRAAWYWVSNKQYVREATKEESEKHFGKSLDPLLLIGGMGLLFLLYTEFTAYNKKGELILDAVIQSFSRL